MPPPLALLAAYALAFWAIRKDSRENPYPSAVLWLPTLWLMRCASRTVDYWLGGGETGRLDPLLIALMLILGIFVLVRRSTTVNCLVSQNSGAILFYIVILISPLWAEDIAASAIKVLRPLGDLAMAMIVVTEPEPRRAIMTIFRRNAFLLIPLSIVVIRYYPQLGRMPDKHWGLDSWTGVTTHKNPLGQLCFASTLAFFWSLHEAKTAGQKLGKRYVDWLYLGMILYILNGGGEASSRSSTSMLCITLTIGLFIWFGYMKASIQKLLRRIILGAIGILLLAGLLQLFGTSLQGVVAGMYGKDATLSDRTYLWDDVIRIGAENPILGTGYGSFWTASIYPKLSPMVDNGPAEAHNGYLETFANLGLVGVFFLIVFIIQSIKSASTHIRSDFEYGRMRITVIFTILIMNYSEATFPRGTHLWWFGFLVFALYIRRPNIDNETPTITQRISYA